MQDLKELRKRCEGNNPTIEFEREEKIGDHHVTSLVVVRDKNLYRCLRYFPIGFGEDAKWHVSIDGDKVSAKTVIKWLSDPRAIS